MKMSVPANAALAARACLALMLTLVAACGGGDSSPSYSISISPSSLAFTGTQGVTTPPQIVTATFRGEGVIVGTLPGQALPGWLSIVQASAPVDGQVQFRVSVSAGAAPGAYATTLRFLSGTADGANIVYADLQISFQQRAAFGLTGTSHSFQGIEGSATVTQTSTTALAVVGDNVSWRATANQPWIQFIADTGTAAGPINFAVNPAGLSAGTHFGQISVLDSVSGRTLTASVQLTLRAPQFLTSTPNLAINVDTNTTPTQLPTRFTISDELGGTNAAADYSWTVSARSGLVRVAPVAGRTSPSATEIVVDIDPARWNQLQSGQTITQIEVAYTRRGVTQIRLIPLTISIRLPSIGSAYPFVVAPNVAGRTTLVGKGLEEGDLAAIRIGGQVPTAVRRNSSQEVELDYAPLSPGQHPISLVNGLGIARSVAEVSAIGSVTAGTGEVTGSGGKKAKLMFDGTRGVLYAADYTASEVQRYRWNGSAFEALSAVAVPSVRDIAFARNNRELYAVSFAGLYSIDMTNLGPIVAQRRLADVDIGCDGALYRLAVPEDGSILSSPFSYGCFIGGQYGGVLSVDLLSWNQRIFPAVTTLVNPSAPSLAASRTGRYVAVGSSSTSSGSYFLFDMRTNTALDFGSYSRYSWYYYHALDVSETGDRILFHASNSYRVRDASGATVCFIPGTPAAARLTDDGSKAYVYLHVDGGGGRVAVYNTSSGAPMGGPCTEITAESTAVPFTMGTMSGDLAYEPNFVMTIDESQRRLFLAGPDRIVALAIQ